MPIGIKIRRPGSFRDPRLAIGILLVISAVVMTIWTIKLATHQDKYYVAQKNIVPGTPLKGSVLRQVDANLGTSSQFFVKAGQLPENSVSKGHILPGEFLPQSAIATHNLNLRKIVIQPSTALPAGLGPGDEVELWELPTRSNGTYEESQDNKEAVMISSNALLGERISNPDSLNHFGKVSIEIRIPQQDVPVVLEAVGSARPLVLIPVHK